MYDLGFWASISITASLLFLVLSRATHNLNDSMIAGVFYFFFVLLVFLDSRIRIRGIEERLPKKAGKPKNDMEKVLDWLNHPHYRGFIGWVLLFVFMLSLGVGFSIIELLLILVFNLTIKFAGNYLLLVGTFWAFIYVMDTKKIARETKEMRNDQYSRLEPELLVWEHEIETGTPEIKKKWKKLMEKRGWNK